MTPALALVAATVALTLTGLLVIAALVIAAEIQEQRADEQEGRHG